MGSLKKKIYINFLSYLLIKKFISYLTKSFPSKDISDQDLDYLISIVSLYHRIKNVPGHIAEIGVASGRNAIYFGKLIKMFNHQSVRRYIGFDTFEGFNTEDLKNDPQLKNYNNKWKINSKKDVINRCFINEVEDVVEIFEGDANIMVPKILKDYDGRRFRKGKAKFALLYIDCNAEKTAISCMESFYNYMSPGSLIVIDEKLQGGETSAILKFAKSKGLNVNFSNFPIVPIEISLPS